MELANAHCPQSKLCSYLKVLALSLPICQASAENAKAATGVMSRDTCYPRAEGTRGR